jgi:hypothetical protein
MVTLLASALMFLLLRRARFNGFTATLLARFRRRPLFVFPDLSLWLLIALFVHIHLLKVF